VLVTNSTSQKFATTNIKGVFKIEATIGDTLIFSHLSFSIFNETVTDVMLKLELVPVQVSDKINKLAEVTVNAFPNINALSLRIIDHEIEELTTNERRLKTAGDFKPIHLLSILGGSLAIDPIINKISGKTNKLKKLIKFDQDEDYFSFIMDTQSDYIKTQVGVSEDELNRFIYFLVDKKEIREAIQSHNNFFLQFIIQDMAIQFNKD
jgi:hypothetical protein